MMSFGDHVKNKNLALANSIKDKKKIYLDTKYWVDFCDMTLGKNNNGDIKNIYDICKRLVDEKKAIFPTSYRIFIELIKQTDKDTLLQTTKIMDTLSQGVAIISEDERVDLELLYFLRNSMQETDLYEPIELVWTKVSNIMGVLSPESSFLSSEENLHLSKSFFDHLWNISLYERISTMGMDGVKSFQHSSSFADILNKGKFENIEQNNTLRKTYMSEIGGVIDVNEKKISNLFLSIFKEKHKFSIEDSKLLSNTIYHIFDKQKNELFLPSWDIMAKIHSIIRWDKNRKYKDNDSHDIGHIVIALPYFDYFFTERSFATLITQSKYDEKYHCNVAWKHNEVLNLIKKIRDGEG